MEAIPALMVLLALAAAAAELGLVLRSQFTPWMVVAAAAQVVRTALQTRQALGLKVATAAQMLGLHFRGVLVVAAWGEQVEIPWMVVLGLTAVLERYSPLAVCHTPLGAEAVVATMSQL
jgi:hypothetical protein